MPPYQLWLQGRPEEIGAWLGGPGIGCRGSKLLPVAANGSPAFAQYRPGDDGGHDPWALQVVELSGGQIVANHTFLDTQRWFPLFDVPPRLDR